MVDNSELGFKSVNKEKMDFYQYCTCDELKFFYIRNNLYMENLTEQEKEFLTRYSKNADDISKEEIENFVKNSFHKVIVKNNEKEELEYLIPFGPDSIRYFAKSNSIVIGFRYEQYDTENKTEDEWYEIYKKREFEFLNSFLKETETYFQSILPNQNIKIMQYNDFSVKK